MLYEFLSCCHFGTDLYHIFVSPYVSCILCSSVGINNLSTNLNRIIILQKVVRLISKKTFDAHTDPLFKEFQILKFDLFQIGEF